MTQPSPSSPYQEVHQRARRAVFGALVAAWDAVPADVQRDMACRTRCGHLRVDRAGSTDWDAYDCYRLCLGLEPVERPFGVRVARQIGRRVAEGAPAVSAGCAQSLVYTGCILGVVLGLAVLALVLNFFARTH